MDAHDDFPASAALSLMLAVIATSDTPLLLLAGDLTVVAASTSFCLAFDIDPATVPGKPVLGMGDGEWDVPQLGSLLAATASGAAEIQAYELDLRRPNHGVRHLVLSVHRLDYEDKVRVRLLLAVADVTDARASEKLKDDLIRDKAVLLREVQHRIANSLQIIASVLLQSARRVQSEETRSLEGRSQPGDVDCFGAPAVGPVDRGGSCSSSLLRPTLRQTGRVNDRGP